MDYGKLAYLKAEELEKRLALTGENRLACTDYTANPTFDLSTGQPYAVSALIADGTATIVVVATVSGAGASGELKLYLGKDLLASQKVAISSSNNEICIFTRAINLYDERVLSVVGVDLNATLKSIQVVLIGQKADMRTNLNSSAVDKFNGTWMLVDCQNDRVRVLPFNENEFNLDTEIFIGSGKCCDICVGLGSCIVCYIDDVGNTTVCRVNSANTASGYTVTGSGASACAICAHGDKYILCEIVNGKVYCSKLNSALTSSARLEVETPFLVDGISFVKNAKSPMLVLYANGRSYLKVLEPKQQTADCVSVSVSLSIN